MTRCGILVFDRSSATFQPAPEPVGVSSGVGFNGSSFDIGFLWLAICPLAFIIVHHRRGVNVRFGEVWQHTLRKIVPILGVYILLWLLSMGVGIALLSLTLTGLLDFLIEDASVGFSVPIFLILPLGGVATIYFWVKWSLSNQCVIIDNLSVVAALRRSGTLVRGAWGRFFGMYLLLALGIMVFTTAVFGLTLLLFSVVAPEFVLLREVLLSGKFFTLFFGGYVQVTLQHAPVWAIVVMLVVNILRDAVFAPIWALLTTHFYMERAGTEQNATSY